MGKEDIMAVIVISKKSLSQYAIMYCELES